MLDDARQWSRCECPMPGCKDRRLSIFFGVLSWGNRRPVSGFCARHYGQAVDA